MVDLTQDLLDFGCCIGGELLQASGELLPDLVPLRLRTDGDQLSMDVLLVILHPSDFIYTKLVYCFTRLRTEIAEPGNPFILDEGEHSWFWLYLAVLFAALLEADLLGGHQLDIVAIRKRTAHDLKTIPVKSFIKVYLRSVYVVDDHVTDYVQVDHVLVDDYLLAIETYEGGIEVLQG